MGRKNKSVNRPVMPDVKYNSVVISKFVSRMMLDGKKATSVRIVYGALDLLKAKTDKDPLEVFLKALSIARNQGYPTFDITTANFDLIDLGDYRASIGYENPQYYYRPRKNIVNRPTSCGGFGWHFCGDHQHTIPTLYDKLQNR